MLNWLQEFKKFATRGNVIDLAVGVIIGAAFGKIINSVVADLFMPAASMLTGKIDFKNHFFAINGKTYASLEDARKAEAPILTYGNFIQNLVEFLIIAFVVFLVVKFINRFHQKPEVSAPVSAKECPFCISSIPLKAVRCPQCTSQL